MLLDNLCPLLVLVFIVRGYFKGFIASAVGIIAVIAAYAGSYFLCRPLGQLLSKRAGLGVIPSILLAGMLIFLGINLIALVGLFFYRRRLKRVAKEKNLTDHMPNWDRYGGMGLGGIQGAAFCFIILWILSLFPMDSEFSKHFDTANSDMIALVRSATREITLVVCESFTGDRGMALLVSKAVQDPEGTKKIFQEFVSNPKVQALQMDPEFRSKIMEGDVESALNSDAVKSLLTDPELLKTLGKLGIADEGDLPSQKELDRMIKESHSAMLRATTAIRRAVESPKVKALLSDPRIVEAARKGDFTILLRNPELTSALFEEFKKLEAGGQ